MQDRFTSPLFWAVMIGWILSVVLHEFAHGIVAYLGGDYTIRERGGLTLNPLQYVHPVNSILLPIIFLAIGGVPLPGGATYVRRDLLRNHFWDAAVSLAGPAMNFLLFLACALPMHPKIGLILADYGDPTVGVPAVLSTLAILQLVSVFINLIPVPPLDGFGAISAFMEPETRAKFFSPQVILMSMIILFVVLSHSPEVMGRIYLMTDKVILGLGFSESNLGYFKTAFNAILFGST